jgi:hypothetical protein
MEKAYRRVMRRMTALLAIASVVALLIVAAPASAATSAEEGYSPPGARIEQRVDPGEGSLPFTGLDVLAVVAVGGALLAVGFGVRKLASSNAA